MSGVQIAYEPTGCNCDGTSYSKQAINAACAEALKLASQKKTLGGFHAERTVLATSFR